VGTPEVIAGVAALAAVATGAGSYLLGAKRLTHERRLADRADARAILAAAARQLWRMKQEMRTQFTALSPGLQFGEWPDDFERRIGSLEEHRDAVERELDVLCIRFMADGKVAVAYRSAWKSTRGLLSIYMQTAGGPSNREELKVAVQFNNKFDEARRTFLAEAQTLVGSALDDEKFVGRKLADEI
jgi:hypothetical protein